MTAADHKFGISWALGIVIMIGGTFAVWDRLGWITIPAYASDHTEGSVEEQQIKILTALEVIKSDQTELKRIAILNQDQWECDETDEELEDLEISLIKVQTPQEKAKLNRQKEKLNGVWTKLDCVRFTD